MPDINMPKLSDTMEEGTIVEWKKKSGDEVKTGEVLAEVESDKATFDLEAESDGVLQILVEQGVPAKIGAPIAKIGEGAGQPKEPAPTKQAPPKKQEPAEAKPEEPETPPTIAEEQEPAPKSAPPREAPRERPAPSRPESRDGQSDDGGIKASPLARRLAGEMGVDLASLKGSGPAHVRAAPPAAPRPTPRRPGRRGDRALAHAGHHRAPDG